MDPGGPVAPEKQKYVLKFSKTIINKNIPNCPGAPTEPIGPKFPLEPGWPSEPAIC